MLPWLLVSVLLTMVAGHGRLIEPPSRGTMWRYGFSTPADYNDHELYCGGYSRQWNKNGGKCGICGDPWDSPTPRPHEAGGKYGQGVIVRRYKKNSVVTIRIELTANHRGYFEFRLCPNNNPRLVGSQKCLDTNVLARSRLADGEQTHPSRYYPGAGNKIFEARYRLPEGLTCSQCILQWRYVAGNNWGTCENGTGAVGCGPQEEFRACSDVSVVDSEGSADETPYPEDNEVPTDDEDVKQHEADASDSEETLEYYLIAIIATISLVAVATVLALVYLYYYHAGERVKKWLSVERFRKQQQQQQQRPPVPPPRTKKQPC